MIAVNVLDHLCVLVHWQKKLNMHLLFILHIWYCGSCSLCWVALSIFRQM